MLRNRIRHGHDRAMIELQVLELDHANFYWCKLNNDHECGWWVTFTVTSACPSNASLSHKAWSRSRNDRASVHQNSTCGAAENVGTAAKPDGIMHEPVRADRPNAFSNNSSSVLSCIQTAVDIPSQSRKIDVPPNMFLG
ncbi:hypothetical protein T459_07240 [Capsicum annuum]|uniref:Uncharacterized protein n=1 Tax=Capsicum annuum TaxID=4072 RepID=A0A2G2ZT32_CAPAN|nr:hypothetical protein T459_07240 [Capsicum annuum]